MTLPRQRIPDLDYAEALAWPRLSREDAAAAADGVLASSVDQQRLTARFEDGFARWLSVPHALSFPNCTSALYASAHALRLPMGGEILAPAFTFWASVLPFCSHGLTPVFCDVDPRTFTIDPDDVERKITSRSCALLAVHLFGQLADMDRLQEIARRHGLALIEDASQALGATWRGRRAGSIGHAGCFSFQTSKYLPLGEGGMLATSDRETWDRAMALGDYRRLASGDPAVPHPLARTGLGCKFRMHPSAAALGLRLLPRLEAFTAKLRGDAAVLNSYIQDLRCLDVPGERPHGERTWWTRWHVRYLPQRATMLSRADFETGMQRAGIKLFSPPTPYARGLHREPIFQQCEHSPAPWFGGGSERLREAIACVGRLPVTESIESGDYLTIPVFPGATPEFMHRYGSDFRATAESLQRGGGT